MTTEQTTQQSPETKTEVATPAITPTSPQVETAKPVADTGPNFGNMSAKDLRVYAESMLELKRAANLEAKQYREQKEAITNEFETFKKNISVKETQSQFLAKVAEAGLNPKVAKAIVASISDLSADNMDVKVAEVLKEYAELVTAPATDGKTPVGKTPKGPAPHAPITSKKSLGDMSREELLAASIEQTRNTT